MKQVLVSVKLKFKSILSCIYNTFTCEISIEINSVIKIIIIIKVIIIENLRFYFCINDNIHRSSPVLNPKELRKN